MTIDSWQSIGMLQILDCGFETVQDEESLKGSEIRCFRNDLAFAAH
jgi:hypothetical protein